MKLVIVSGPPASGKTAIGQKIADNLGYEFYSKDALKEELFGSQSRTTHDYLWYEVRAKERFFRAIEHTIANNKPAIIESNFTTKDKERLISLLDGNVQVLEIYCTAKGFTRLKRFIKRNEDRSRHSGHHDRRWYMLMLIETLYSYIGIKWPHGPFNISNKRLAIDTTQFSKVDYKNIVQFVQQT